MFNGGRIIYLFHLSPNLLVSQLCPCYRHASLSLLYVILQRVRAFDYLYTVIGGITKRYSFSLYVSYFPNPAVINMFKDCINCIDIYTFSI